MENKIISHIAEWHKEMADAGFIIKPMSLSGVYVGGTSVMLEALNPTARVNYLQDKAELELKGILTSLVEAVTDIDEALESQKMFEKASDLTESDVRSYSKVILEIQETSNKQLDKEALVERICYICEVINAVGTFFALELVTETRHEEEE